ncbi:hypothetical protein BPTFM16_01413 [Altererythrobacter insulae]|nr:hypothetical protein BPTFM16_01413 [Altererythrobacter insulae]
MMKSASWAMVAVGVSLLAAPNAAHATDDAFEVWLNPSIEYNLEDDTSVELETAQRFRGDGRVDTYFARLWLNKDFGENFTLSGGIEQRENDGGFDEVRLLQQVSAKQGYFRARLRFEQRWVEDQSRVGFRLRPRLGVEVPINEAGDWSFKTDAELFLTLKSTSAGGKDGLTGFRSQFGVSHDVNDSLTLSLTYLRQQDFRDNAPDRVGHAPLIGVSYSF